MAEIKTIYLGNMNNGAHYLFVRDVAARAEADAKVKEKAASQVAALSAAAADEDANLKLPRKQMLTDHITLWDGARDTDYTLCRRVAASYVGYPVADVSDAAIVVNQLFNEYGIDTRMQLDKETGLLFNLVADLEGKYAAQVEALSLTPFVQRMKEANEKVHELTEERAEERMGKNLGALKACREKSDLAFAKLTKYINALALIEGEEEYADFILYVNDKIKHYKQEVLGTPEKNPGGEGEDDRPVIPDEDDRPEIPDEEEGETGKDENGDDLPEIE